MDRKLKTAVRKAFEPPAPTHGQAFWREHRQPPITMAAFVYTQAFYIRKWVWMLDLCVFVAALSGAAYIGKDMLWCICAMTPLLALALLTENGRSESCGMAEFEMATRFSLRSVILARMGILGLTDGVLLCLLAGLGRFYGGVPLAQAGVYMICPYLLTAFLGMWAARVIHGRESAYLCVGIAVAVSLLCVFTHFSWPVLYERRYFSWWTVCFLLLCVGIVRESCHIIKREEVLN